MSSIHQRSSLALKIMMLLDHIGYFFCPQQSLSCIKGTLDLKLWNSWHRSASSAKFSAIYHPLMPSILDSPSLSIRSIYIYIILYYTHVSFNFLSLPSKWKWNSCRLCKPTLWQFPTYPNFMYAMASCIVRGFFRRAAAVKTRERERERGKKDCGVVPERRRRTHDHIDAVYALLYLFKTELWAYHVKRSELTYTYDTYKIHICWIVEYVAYTNYLRQSSTFFMFIDRISRV